jgi:hypothetical protein
MQLDAFYYNAFLCNGVVGSKLAHPLIQRKMAIVQIFVDRGVVLKPWKYALWLLPSGRENSSVHFCGRTVS